MRLILSREGRPHLPGPYPSFGTAFFWEPELHAMAKEWSARAPDSVKSPGSVEAFEKWKQSQKELIQSRIDVSIVPTRFSSSLS